MLVKEHLGEGATNGSQFKSTREIGVGTKPVGGQKEAVVCLREDRLIDEVGKGEDAERAGEKRLEGAKAEDRKSGEMRYPKKRKLITDFLVSPQQSSKSGSRGKVSVQSNAPGNMSNKRGG